MPPLFGGSPETVRRISARIRAIVREPFGERSDQIAIGAQSKNLESRHPTLVEALAVVFDCPVL